MIPSVPKLVSLYLGATLVVATAATDFDTSRGHFHGKLDEFNGKPVRWHQLAQGVFTGVNPDEWDDNVHKRGMQEWDMEEVLGPKYKRAFDPKDGALRVRDLEYEARNLEQRCQALASCTKQGGKWLVANGYELWLRTADYARGGTVKKDIMDFLNQPFVANAGGVAIAGLISGGILGSVKTECSTNKSDSTTPNDNPTTDQVQAAIAAALAGSSEAQEIKVEVNGPSGSWSITVSAGQENSQPSITCS